MCKDVNCTDCARNTHRVGKPDDAIEVGFANGRLKSCKSTRFLSSHCPHSCHVSVGHTSSRGCASSIRKSQMCSAAIMCEKIGNASLHDSGFLVAASSTRALAHAVQRKIPAISVAKRSHEFVSDNIVDKKFPLITCRQQMCGLTRRPPLFTSRILAGSCRTARPFLRDRPFPRNTQPVAKPGCQDRQ